MIMKITYILNKQTFFFINDSFKSSLLTNDMHFCDYENSILSPIPST